MGNLALSKPDFLQIIAWALAVNNQEAALGIKHQNWMVQHIACIVDALAAGCVVGAKAAEIGGVRADDDKPGPVLQGKEDLAAEGMAFHELERDGLWTRFPNNDADIDRAALGGDIHPGQIVKPFGEALVDREVSCAVRLHDVAERHEALLGQRYGVKGSAHRTVSFIWRLTSLYRT